MSLKKILLFNDFINEKLYKVLTDRSGSGKTKITDTILDDPSSAKATGSGVLLRKQLSDVEMLDTIKSAESGNHKNDRLSIVINNLEFLKHQKSILGDLYCEYCNRGPLKIYEFDYSRITNPINNKKYSSIRFNNKFSKKDGATTDHKNPISKGGDLYDYSNLAVCCSYCNQRKGNMSYDNWINLKRNTKPNKANESKKTINSFHPRQNAVNTQSINYKRSSEFKPFPVDIQEEICDFIGTEYQKASDNQLVYLENFIIQIYNMDRWCSYDWSESGMPNFDINTIFITILLPIGNFKIQPDDDELYITRTYSFNFNGDLIDFKNSNYRKLSEGKLKKSDNKLDLVAIKNYLSNPNLISYIKDAIDDLTA